MHVKLFDGFKVDDQSIIVFFIDVFNVWQLCLQIMSVPGSFFCEGKNNSFP